MPSDDMAVRLNDVMMLGALLMIADRALFSGLDFNDFEHMYSRLKRDGYVLTPRARGRVARMFARAKLGEPEDSGAGERE